MERDREYITSISSPRHDKPEKWADFSHYLQTTSHRLRETHQVKSENNFIKQYITVIRVTLAILAITSDRAE